MKYKCKTCKHWDYQGFDVGKCSGILPRTTIISIPNQPKEKPDAKLITQKGIITNGTFFMTDKNWACINWSKK